MPPKLMDVKKCLWTLKNKKPSESLKIRGFFGLLRISPNSIYASPIFYYSNLSKEPLYSKIEIVIPDHRPLIYKEFTDASGKTTGAYLTKAQIWAIEQNKNAPFCKCGCGKKIVVDSRHRYRGIPEYLPYHQPDFNKSKKKEPKS